MRGSLESPADCFGVTYEGLKRLFPGVTAFLLFGVTYEGLNWYTEARPRLSDLRFGVTYEG